MTEDNGVGMLCAILSGVMNAFGAILQKSAVNRIPPTNRDKHFMRQLLLSPAWLSGLGASMGLGTVFNLSAQRLIGPAMVPGLTASGMIVLAVGSVKLIGEKLKPGEVLGIVLLVFGISLLGYANLGISGQSVDLLDGQLLLRIGLFSLGLGLCWMLFYFLALRSQDQPRGLVLAFSGAFLFCLSNLWILPLMLTIGPVFAGRAVLPEAVLFVLACLLLVGTNVAGIRQVQEAYKFAPASKVQPMQQIPTQIVPVLIYFLVFQRSASGLAALFIPLAVSLIIAGGFLLGKRRAELK